MEVENRYAKNGIVHDFIKIEQIKSYDASMVSR